MAKPSKTTSNKKKKGNQSKRTRSRKLVLIFAAFLLLYFVYSIVSIQIDIYKQRQVLGALQQQIEQQRIQSEELQRDLANGGEDYIERVARERLGFAAPDERVFVASAD